MEQMNQVILRGNVGSVRTSPLAEGRSVSTIKVATNTITRLHDGTTTQETHWASCVMWSNKRFPNPDQIVVGTGVEIVGRLRSNRYTGTDGQERYGEDVVITDIKLLPAGERLTPIVI